jgi:hypothetical protein
MLSGKQNAGQKLTIFGVSLAKSGWEKLQASSPH